MPNIVNVEVSQQVAPAPSTLQGTGAFISQGATTLEPGTTALLTTLSSLSAILTGSVTVTSATWATGVVTVVCATPHGIPSGDTVPVILSGFTPNAYNGTFAATYVNSTTFTYPLAANPGLTTVVGIVTLENVQELVAMNNTFFAQGQNVAVYVLELGAGTPAEGVTSLTAYLTNPEIRMYSYLLPKAWDTESTMVSLATEYNGTTAQTYFYVTTTLATYSAWAGIKSVFAAVQSPSAPITEFSLSAMFRVTLAYNPNASNLAHPLSFSYIYGVTAYASLTNTQQTTLKAAGVNWVGTGAEGGISNTIIFWGTFMDLSPFNYWYAVDWLAINVEIALANAIINGSNLPTNPLYYNQNGINTLQKVAQATVNNGIAFGMILSPAAVAAISFITYVTQNPSDYATGTYNGLSVTFIPARGFTSITIYLTASNIPV
jgi:hypothetical protein